MWAYTNVVLSTKYLAIGSSILYIYKHFLVDLFAHISQMILIDYAITPSSIGNELAKDQIR